MGGISDIELDYEHFNWLKSNLRDFSMRLGECKYEIF